ncbi:aminotransferase class V-fold PLP-dependent enzyme [Ferroplasma acidiphilum]|jgi:cystathionine gamma-synthase|uniref:aminotransferase class V-fold PLP-dependent enzyme n=1 Tax=Ferroplasma acidiphilum TaxID=74969 RepID=UPI0028151861|nr:aminotransferase class V-fold PLP-dependent enzyme [Ferroplasma acidiphilum]WMT52784.1 MAG: aminotransferase class V-fold PLP-dependent enzyme [Ferroplasma acidiphilum]
MTSNRAYAAPLTYPIYQTSSYIVPEGEKYRYSREYNPTVENLGIKIKEMEGAEDYNVFSSGMGAITTTLLSLSKPGDRILTHLDTFARSYHFIRDFMGKWGIKPDIANPGTENIINGIKKDTGIVFIESITNPILRVNDISTISEKCHDVGAILVVDSTVPTPYNVKSLKLGADIVVHSSSKFIAGHNNVISGLAAGRKDLMEKIDAMRRTLGTSLDPNSAFLTENGMKTLEIRMEKINSNAMEIAAELQKKPEISKVIYPGLPEHPDHEIAKKYMKGYSGIVCFKVKTDPEKFIGKLEKIVPANTMGGTETVISIPASMSHRSLTSEELNVLGVDSTFMRLSVGIEDPDEIVRDINRALND